MASLPDGDYLIVSAADTSLRLDVQGASQDDNAWVGVWASNSSEAQVWHLTSTATGYKITSPWNGRCFGLVNANKTVGTYFWMHTDNGSVSAQRWDMVAAGSKVTVDGKQYDAYRIAYHPDNSYCVAEDGRWVSLAQKADANSQLWAFVPLPLYSGYGCFELRSQVNPSLVLGVENASKADGGWVQLQWRDGSNAQKWALVPNSDGSFGVRNVNSGKMLDVYSGKLASMQGSTGQWLDQRGANGSNAQKWKIKENGTRTLDGETCQVVNLMTAVDYSYALDFNDYRHFGNADWAIVWKDTSATYQNVVLYPTTAEDPNMPAPYDLSMADEAGGATYTTDYGTGKDERYFVWKCSQAWATPYGNSYQARFRKRLMGRNGTWGGWTSWSQWATPACRVDGVQAWWPEPVSLGYDESKYRNEQVQLQVRTAGNDGAQRLHGAASTAGFYLPIRPTVTATAAGWSQDGLTVQASSGYALGPTKLVVISADFGKGNVLSGEVEASLSVGGSSFVIPKSKLKAVPSDGATATLTVYAGTDQGVIRKAASKLTANVAYTAGSVSLDAKVASTKNALVEVSFTNLGTSHCWYVAGGKVATAKGGKGIFTIAAPFGRPVEIYVESRSADGKKWGMQKVCYTPTYKPCHAWSWDGGSASLQVRKDEALSTSHSVTANTASYDLAGRDYETVVYEGGEQASYSPEGDLVSGLTDSTKDSFLRLLKACEDGKRVLYRSPHGDFDYVAVTGVTFDEDNISTSVKVDQKVVG